MTFFVFILPVLLAVVFGAHYIVYLSLVHLFSIASPTYRAGLLVVFAVLSVSFFLAAFWSHVSDTFFTRCLYVVTAVWMGTLVNLFLAMLAARLIEIIGYWFQVSVSLPVLGAGFLVVAILVSVYGVWNAFTPRYENITVHIPGLPVEWRGEKIVQISDVHLGHIYRDGFMEDIVQKINAVDPALVVITGDLFDGMDGGLDAFVRPLNDLRARHGALFVTGNHETYLGVQEAFGALEKTSVRILQDEVVDIDGLKIIGVSYPLQGERKNIVATLETLQSQYFGRPNVLLYHAPAQVQEMRAAGINLQLSGHTHQGQQFPFMFITQLVHHGFDYGLYPMGEYTLYTSSGVGTWGPPMRVGTQSEIVVITLN